MMPASYLDEIAETTGLAMTNIAATFALAALTQEQQAPQSATAAVAIIMAVGAVLVNLLTIYLRHQSDQRVKELEGEIKELKAKKLRDI